MCHCVLFFFSSRRRHTRCSRDWSSDVCSSDLSTLSALLSSKVSALRSDRGVKRITTLAESVCVEGKSWASMRYRSTVNGVSGRSEEHTSELQSRLHLVCRLLLEKKKKKTTHNVQLSQVLAVFLQDIRSQTLVILVSTESTIRTYAM